jgi:hypothetical protein
MQLRTLLSTIPILVASAFAACGAEADGTFDRNEFPFTFSYPEGFEETEDVTIAQELGAAPDETVAIGLDNDNVLLIQTFTLNLPINDSNLDLAKAEFDQLAQQLDGDAEFTRTQVAGLPGLEVENVPVESVPDGESRITAIFDGDQEYLLNCQSTPKRRSAMEEACDLALETFELR